MRDAEQILRAVFETVIEKAREDPRFAERLIAALGKEIAVSRPKRKPVEVALPPALETLDLSALAAQGRRAAQRALLDGPYTVAMLKEFARRREISLKGAGRRKIDIVAAILAATPISRAAAFG